MLYEMHALQQEYAAQTGFREVLRANCMTEFFENNFADFSGVVRVKKKFKISSSCWWRFQLAASPIKAYDWLSRELQSTGD